MNTGNKKEKAPLGGIRISRTLGMLFLFGLVITAVNSLFLNNRTDSALLCIYTLLAACILSGISSWHSHMKDLKLNSRGLQYVISATKTNIFAEIIQEQDFEKRINKLTEWQAQLEQAVNSNTCRLNHWSRRLDTLRQAVFSQQKKIHSVPSMEDLHDLTYVSILTENKAGVLNVVVSSLLILGICGTLVGVHSVISEIHSISDNSQVLSHIKVALYPSAIAVSFTVILIILRNICQHRMEKYIARLDHLTLSHYLPVMQPASISEGTFKELTAQLTHFNQVIKEFADNVDSVGAVAERAKKTADTLERAQLNLTNLNSSFEIDGSCSGGMDSNARLHMLSGALDIMNHLLAESRLLEQALQPLPAFVNKVDKRFTETLMARCAQVPVIDKIPEDFTSVMEHTAHAQVNMEHNDFTALQIQQVQSKSLIGPLKNGEYYGKQLQELQQKMVDEAKVSQNNLSNIRSRHDHDAHSPTDAIRQKYEAYRQLITEKNARVKNQVLAQKERIDNTTQYLHSFRRALRERIGEYSKEPFMYWYEPVIVLLVLGYLCVNIYYTIY